MTAWYEQTPDEVLQALQTGPEGLSAAEAASRLQTAGPNELQERKGKPPLRMLLEQFTETTILVLLAAAIISLFLGKTVEAVAILAVVVLFAVLGFVQEYRAERAIAALKQLAVPTVRVRREGKVQQISARDLVPGDIVLLEAGNVVPADLRLLESVSLRIQEAALTGESEPVEKQAEALPEPGLSLGDRLNMGYLGTAVTYGRGAGAVVATGMQTELGKIAALVQGVEAEPTPLQRRLDRLGKVLALLGLGAAVVVALIGILRGEPVADMLLTGISVAVAVIPEGLPAVVTITLALGAQRMLRRHALMRRLPAVETLGSVTVICSDKTGTLTENRMTVTVLDVAGERLQFDEALRHREPWVAIRECRPPAPGSLMPSIALTLVAGALANDALLHAEPEAGRIEALGDPTEGALLVAAAQTGFLKTDLEAALPRVAELPFESDRKRMTTVHGRGTAQAPPDVLQAMGDAPYIAFTKGAVEGLLEIGTHVWTGGRSEPLGPDWRARIQAANDQLALGGARVLGVAFRPLPALPEDPATQLEQDLTFVGLAGLIDPPRPAVRPAIETCRTAGIRPVMITGDQALTAISIARDLQITDRPEALSGAELARLTDEGLEAAVDHIAVYARVSPEDKLRIVGALQRRGQIVAMTGDGVNDAPALKRADIGVAMGITGTDVAKESAAMVLLDDNFTTIVAAVEEGRVILDNLVRFVKFSLGGNLGKLLVVLASPIIGITVALLPLQLLWLNLLTDGLLGLGLGTEPGEPDTMRRPVRPPDAPILDRAATLHVSWVGVLIALLTLGLTAGYLALNPGEDALWQTIIFATIGFTQMGHALGLRAGGRSALSPVSNPLMTVVTLAALVLQLAVIYLPFLQPIFALRPLPAPVLLLTGAMGLVVFIAVRLERRVRRS